MNLTMNHTAPLEQTTGIIDPNLVIINTTTTPKPWDPLYPPENKCNYYLKNNVTYYFNFTNQYGGIPQNLVFNLIGWIILMVCKCII